MEHKYSILQLKDVYNPKVFMWLDYVNEKLGGVDINEYIKTYEGTIEGDNNISMLEELFEIFNIRHPEDFHGHSLSVSDIVILDDIIWYCDSTSWQEIGKI